MGSVVFRLKMDFSTTLRLKYIVFKVVSRDGNETAPEGRSAHFLQLHPPFIKVLNRKTPLGADGKPSWRLKNVDNLTPFGKLSIQLNEISKNQFHNVARSVKIIRPQC